MKKIINLAQLCIILATLTLGVQAWLDGQRLEALLVAILGMVWLIGFQRSLAWLDALMLVLFTLLVVYTLLRDRPILPGFIVILSALIAWNLGHLTRRLAFSSDPGISRQLTSKHLRRSGILTGIALVLVLASYLVKIELNLGWAILVGAFGIIGLSQLVGYLLKQKQ
jgi:hypothetical protein